MTAVAHFPAPANAPRNVDVGRAYAVWKPVAEAGNISGGLEILASLDHLTRAFENRNRPLLEMRRWQVGALMRRNRLPEAEAWLDLIEGLAGASFFTAFRRAKIHYYRGDHSGAALWARSAILLLNPQVKPSADYWAACRFLVDCISSGGDPAGARATMYRLFASKEAWTSEDLRHLRLTVTDDVGLEDFFAFLGPAIHTSGNRSRVALYQYSLACRGLGRYAPAEVAVRQRFVSGARSVRFGSKASAVRSNATWKDDAKASLLDLRSALETADAAFFLISGTLLGCVREGGVLGHDKDVDVGVFWDGDPSVKARVEAALQACGYFSVKPYQHPELLRVQHVSGVMIDVFWHRLEGGLVIHEGLKAKWWNSPFDLVSHPFLGAEFLVPSNPDIYLKENYGDWRTPAVEFETFVDTPNMVVTHADEMVWYFYNKLFDYHHAGKIAQFSKVAQALGELRALDAEVRACIERTMAAAAA